LRRPLPFILLFLALASGALAIERFPPPDLGPSYLYPHSSQAPPRLAVMAVVDTLALLVALGLAAYFVFKRRSRRSMVWLTLASLVYFGFYRKGCVCPIGAIQNIAQAAFDTSFLVPWVVIAFFALPILFALFFGRVFCGAVCPLGALQELALVKAITIPRWLEHGLGLFRYFYLGLAVLFAATGTRYLICEVDPFVSFFRLTASFHIWVWSGALLGLSLFIGRPYCRFLCPYGALLGICSRFSMKRVSVTPAECTVCHLCRNACPYGAIREGRRDGEDEA
jgi:polyferredoxin